MVVQVGPAQIQDVAAPVAGDQVMTEADADDLFIRIVDC